MGPARRRQPLLLGLLAAVLLATAVLLLRTLGGAGGGSAAEVAGAREPPAAVESEPAEVAAPARAVDPDLELAVPGGIEIPAGVRLFGSGRLTGRVIDRESGAALGGMRVDLHSMPPAAAPFVGRFARIIGGEREIAEETAPVATTGSDSTGAFAFEGVRPGTWFIESRGARYVPDSVATARVTTAAEDGPVDVYVRPGGRVAGVVLEPDGDPAAGATVTLTPGIERILEALRRGDLVFLEARSDEQGRFVFSGVPPGVPYDVHALRAGLAPARVGGLDVRAGEDTQVVLETRIPGRIAGRVLSVGEPGAEATPLAGAHLAAVSQGLRYLPFTLEILAMTHTRTDAEGRFSMRDVPPGEVHLIGVAEGHVGELGPSVFVPGGGTATAPDFELPVGPTVAGRVVDGSGAPLAGVEVRWQPVDVGRFGFDQAVAPLVARALEVVEFPRTGADGRFTAGAFPGDPPYSIEFRKRGFADGQVDWTPAESEPQEELEVVMGAGGWVEGIVMDVARSEPLTAFTVRTPKGVRGEPDLMDFGPFASGRLVEDPGGRFRVGPLEEGTVQVSFEAPGYLRSTLEDLEIESGETLRGLIVEMYAGGIVRGVAVDEDGAPVAGALVFARLRDPDVSKARPADELPPEPSDRGAPGPPRRTETSGGLIDYVAQLGFLADQAVRSAADGSFELTGLEPGRNEIIGVHREYAATGSEPVELARGGEPVFVELVLRRGGGIFGQVVDRFGQPVPRSIVIAVSPNSFDDDERVSGGLYQGSTDAEGRYSIDNVSKGSYFMVVTRGDEELRPMSFLGALNFDMVTVPEGERVEFDIVDRSAGGTRVFGRVISPGEEIGRGQIVAMGFESESMLGVDIKVAPIRGGGEYEFDGLAPGEYQLQIQAAGAIGSEVRMQIDVPDVPEYQLDLHLPRGRIAGRVVDASTGEAIAGAQVSALATDRPEPQGLLGSMLGRDAGKVHDWTGDDGVFSFERLQAGDYEVAVQSARTDVQRFAPGDPVLVALSEDEDESGLVFELQPALVLHGTVRDAEGAPVEGARVMAWMEERPDLVRGGGETDEQGRFELDEISPGTWCASAAHDDYAEGRTSGIEVERGGTPEVELVLQPGIEVTVRVIGADGRPVSGATGRLVPAGGDEGPRDVQRLMGSLFSGAGVSDKDGMLALGRFLPGEYELVAQRGISRSELQKVKVSGSGPVRLRARLR